MIKAVIFDVDGTLVDSNDFHARAWQEAFQHFGKDIPYAEIRQQIGKGGDQLIPFFCSPEELNRFGKALEQYRLECFLYEYLPQIQPFPKVRELFERLHDDGRELVLASSAKEQEIEHYKALLGIADLLETATSADDATHSKPYPDIFQAALAGLSGVAPAEAIVVGDTPYDAQAAAGAQMRIIGVLSGGFKEEELRRAGAWSIHRDVADLLEHYDDSLFAQEERPAMGDTKSSYSAPI